MNKVKITQIIFCFLIAIILGACSTHSVNRYSSSTDNVVALRKLDSQVNVGKFTALEPGLSQLGCRAVGPVSTPDGEYFEEFIRKAFLDELRLAEKYFPEADITITGNLEEIDFNSMNGTWYIVMTIQSSNGVSFQVSEEYDYRTAYFAETACEQTAKALVPAVQDLIAKIINHDMFPDLFAETTVDEAG